MKAYRGILLYMATVAALSAMGWAQDQAAADAKKTGEAIFKANCVLCHGSDGHSQTALGKQLGALDLHSAEVQKKTDAELKTVISHGQKSMPAFGGQLSPGEIAHVVGYVRGFGKKK